MMAIAPGPEVEIGVEAEPRVNDTIDTGGINSSSAQLTKDPPLSDSDDYFVLEVLKHHSEEDDGTQKSQGFLARLTSGNMFSSGKNGAFRIIKYFAGGAQTIGHRVMQAFSRTPELSPSITESCQLILDTIRKRNNGILVQEKWLDETEYLLKNKVLTIGVFGRHKAGKSTLLNSLLHHEVLSVADNNETAFILRISHKPSNHYGNSCFEDTEQFLFMKEEEIKGRRSIRKTIQKTNSDIREKGATIAVDELEAHVPFLCHCSTGDINIVLLDTPGLSESNELGISEVSEHQLMTCSVFVFVISSQQLEDSIDTDSLKAIVMRDPNAFAEKRILIAVTKLDELKLFNDGSSPDSDDEITMSIDERIDSVKKIIKRQCKDFVSVPDDCIVPLCTTGALEARKEKLRGKRSNEMRILMAKLDVSTAEEMEEVSQIPLLEEKLIEIASKSHYLWHYNIVRDCTRYLDQAMEKLDETKNEFMKLENEFSEDIRKKESFMEKFKTVEKFIKSEYADESEFFRQLETAYTKDLQAIRCNVDIVSKSLFQKFRSTIKELKKVTTEIFNSEAKQFVKNEDESLKNTLNGLLFENIANAVANSTHRLGFIRQKMEQCLALYCDATISTDVSDLPDIDISIIINDSTISVSSSPTLTLKDLLDKVHYGLWDMIKIFFKKLFWGFKDTDPTRPLLEPEIDAFLKELEEHFVKDCHEYLKKIKPGIVQGYLEEHRKIAEKHITDVEQQYFRQREAMDAQVGEWRKQARFNRETVKSHSDLLDNLEKQKVHLLSLANQFGISLYLKQD